MDTSPLEQNRKTIPCKDLKADTLYRCALSGKVVLVCNVQPKTTKILGKDHEYTKVDALIYNEVTGRYDLIDIWNNQLEELI